MNLVDPFGLSSMTYESYALFGWGMVVGKNPDDSSFVSLRCGCGLGEGLSYNPNGISHGYGLFDKSNEPSWLMGVYGEAVAALLTVYIGLTGSAGGSLDYNGFDGYASGGL